MTLLNFKGLTTVVTRTYVDLVCENCIVESWGGGLTNVQIMTGWHSIRNKKCKGYDFVGKVGKVLPRGRTLNRTVIATAVIG